jgi:anti-sigma factor RsiW
MKMNEKPLVRLSSMGITLRVLAAFGVLFAGVLGAVSLFALGRTTTTMVGAAAAVFAALAVIVASALLNVWVLRDVLGVEDEVDDALHRVRRTDSEAEVTSGEWMRNLPPQKKRELQEAMLDVLAIECPEEYERLLEIRREKRNEDED